MTPYQVWLTAALAAFCAGPLGISFWLACSWLAVIPRKRLRLAIGLVAFLILVLSGLIPGLGLLGRLTAQPDLPITAGELVLLGWLHLGFLIGAGILLLGRRRGRQPPIPPTREDDLGLGRRLLDLHRSRSPASPWPRIPGNQAYDVRLRDWRVPITLDGASLPPDLEGFTILHLSDLHMGKAMIPEYFEALAEAAAGVERDVVVLTGDYLEEDGRPEDLERWLRRFVRPGEAMAILGNHDILDHSAGEILGALAGAGVRHLGAGDPPLLHRRGNATAAFVGIDYQNWWRPFPVKDRHAAIPGGALPILLTHTPCPFPRAREAGFSLVLCGHTHGGQIRVPLIGAPFIPARYGRRYQMGLYRSGPSHLHVNTGLGSHPPVRLRCPPEITRVVLTRSLPS